MRGFAPVRKGTCFYHGSERSISPYGTIKYIELRDDSKIDQRDHNRNSSTMLEYKSLIRNHYEHNKKFLRKVETQLIENECENLVINLKDGIITKKRKIRAIYKALDDK
jgi:hypothetical protein